MVGRPGLRRRGFLLLGAAGALGAGGCGAGEDGRPEQAAEQRGGESTLADTAVLRGILEVHDLALAAAAPVPGALGRALREREREHVAAVLDAIAGLNGVVGERVTAPRADETGRAALREALRAQDVAIAMQIDAMAKLSEGALRDRVAGLLAADAAHAAAVRAELGEDPAPAALVRGRRP